MTGPCHALNSATDYHRAGLWGWLVHLILRRPSHHL
jgi:hypothetical protein